MSNTAKNTMGISETLTVVRLDLNELRISVPSLHVVLK